MISYSLLDCKWSLLFGKRERRVGVIHAHTGDSEDTQTRHARGFKECPSRVKSEPSQLLQPLAIPASAFLC